MIGIRQKHRRGFIETDHPVRLGVVDFRAVCRGLQLGKIFGGVVQGEGKFSFEPVLINIVKRTP